MRDDIEGAPAQRKLLEAILDISESGQQIPNYQALAKQLEKSQSRIPESIRKLRDKGFIRFAETTTGRVRTGSIIPTGKAWEWRSRSRAPDSPTVATTVLEQAQTRDVRAYRRGRSGESSV